MCLAALAVLLWSGAGLPRSRLMELFFGLWTRYAFVGGIVAVPYNDIVLAPTSTSCSTRRPAYRTRAGGAVAGRALNFAAVMQQRFGSVTGKVD